MIDVNVNLIYNKNFSKNLINNHNIYIEIYIETYNIYWKNQKFMEHVIHIRKII